MTYYHWLGADTGDDLQRMALERIEKFGYNNPGHGFTCARIASLALGREPRSMKNQLLPEGYPYV